MPEKIENITEINITFFTTVIDVNIDTNSRIVIPALYVKQGLKGECYIVDASSGNFRFCSIFTQETFGEYCRRYLEKPEITDSTFRDRKRAFFAGVKHQKLNAAKPRITLDDDMKEHLAVVKAGTKLVLVGVGDSLELWRKDTYDAWKQSDRLREI